VHPRLARRCRWKDARRLVKGYVEHYNNVRFEQRHRVHHAEGTCSPGIQQEIQAGRDRKLEGSEGTAEESPPAGRIADETITSGLADKQEVTGLLCLFADYSLRTWHRITAKTQNPGYGFPLDRQYVRYRE